MSKSLAITCVVLLLFASACSKKSVEAIRHLSPLEAAGQARNDFAVLVDAREESEIQGSGVAEGAKSLPASVVKAKGAQWNGFVHAQAKGKLVVVYGASESQAEKVAEALAGEGLTVGVMGSFDDWVKAGLPVRK